MSDLALTVRGARGSMAVCGPHYRRYGGNTTCFDVMVGRNHHLVVDCGTGLRNLQRTLSDAPNRFTVLFTHYHWDHLQGLPVFAPLFVPDSAFEFYGPGPDSATVAKMIGAVIRPPWFPVTFDESAAQKVCLPVPSQLTVGPVSITSIRLHHPDPVMGYRLDGPNRSIVVATDHEAGDAAVDERLVELARGADVLIHDAQYTPRDYSANRRGWGHSTWQHAVATAQAAGVRRLILTSHDPDHDDATIDAMVGAARATFPLTGAAYEGMQLEL
jgi:phosphoribosyl 1,2-cyclic phosphodiesterase